MYPQITSGSKKHRERERWAVAESRVYSDSLWLGEIWAGFVEEVTQLCITGAERGGAKVRVIKALVLCPPEQVVSESRAETL